MNWILIWGKKSDIMSSVIKLHNKNLELVNNIISYLNLMKNWDKVNFVLIQRSNNRINSKLLKQVSFSLLIGKKRFKFKWPKNYKNVSLLQIKTYTPRVKSIRFLSWWKVKFKCLLRRSLRLKFHAENFWKLFKRLQNKRSSTMFLVWQVFSRENPTD